MTEGPDCPKNSSAFWEKQQQQQQHSFLRYAEMCRKKKYHLWKSLSYNTLPVHSAPSTLVSFLFLKSSKLSLASYLPFPTPCLPASPLVQFWAQLVYCYPSSLSSHAASSWSPPYLKPSHTPLPISFTALIFVQKDHFECLCGCLLLPSLAESNLQEERNLVSLLCWSLYEYLAQKDQ